MPLVHKIKTFIPALNEEMNKGQCGRVGILGGSAEYTGAPYFAAIAALKTGCDLCHVICPSITSQIIKSYSPDLIVHPILGHGDMKPDEIKQCVTLINGLLNRLDVLVIGPGLSHDPTTILMTTSIITSCIKLNLMIVVDADAIFIIQNNLDLIKGYANCVITPNHKEFDRLFKACAQRLGQDTTTVSSLEPQAKIVSKYLGCTILQKNKSDLIVSNDKTILCSIKASLRRCGGQGDLLAGALATFLAWGINSKEPIDLNIPFLCAYGASRLIRETSYTTYLLYGRSMLASDMINQIGPTFSKIFD